MGLRERFTEYLMRFTDQHVYHRSGESTPGERVVMDASRKVARSFASGRSTLEEAYVALGKIETGSSVPGLPSQYFDFLVRRESYYIDETLPLNLRTFERYQGLLIEAA